MMMNHLNAIDLNDHDRQKIVLVGEQTGGAFSFDEPKLNGYVQLLVVNYERFGLAGSTGAALRCTFATDYDPQFPLRHRGDLPAREREISAESLNLLRQGIEDAKAGRVSPVPARFTEEQDEDGDK